MARQVLGGLTTLNLATNLDPMFAELYDASFMTALSTATVGAGAGVRQMRVNGGSAAGEGAVFTGLRAGANSFVIGNAGGILGGAETADLLFYSYGAVNQRFYTNGVERVRINSGTGDATMLVTGSGRFSGANVSSSALNGMHLGTASGFPQIIWVQSGAPADQKCWDQFASATALNLRALNDANTTASNIMIVNRSGVNITDVQWGATIRPNGDNVFSCGTAAGRWSVVYAGTGSINTSDAREKTKVASLTERELAAAKQLSKEIGAFKFLASVDTKGDDARIHIGMTVQRAIEVMREHDLDPFAYAFICYDEWDAVEHPAEFKTEERDTGLVDTAGKAITETIKTEIKPTYTTPAGNRYGFRVDQLNLFIARGLAARLDDLESGSATA